MAAVPARDRSQTRPSTAPPAVTTCLQTRFGMASTGGTEENLENRIQGTSRAGGAGGDRFPQTRPPWGLRMHG